MFITLFVSMVHSKSFSGRPNSQQGVLLGRYQGFEQDLSFCSMYQEELIYI